MNTRTHFSKTLLTLTAVGLLAFGIALGLGWNTIFKPQTKPEGQAEMGTRKVLYWYDPMVPAQRFDKPGKSPFMDMELVPKYADDTSSTAGVNIDPTQTQKLGMRLAKVERVPLQTQLETTGRLRFNERNLAIVQLRTAGFVEKVWPLAVGDHVTIGQPIAALTVPEWVSAQYEYLALKAAGEPHLLNAARARLNLLGMPETLIARVIASNKPEAHFIITSPINGVIDALEIKTGMSLTSGQTVARINGLNDLWLDAAIPEAQANHLQTGDSAVFTLPNPSEQPITGKLESLLPSLNENTRTVTARVLLPNVDGKLKPGTTGRVVLKSTQSGFGLAVPTEAIIRTGKRTLVMVNESGGRFSPVEISTGNEVGNETHVVAGLTEGQSVVVSSQFLLDSEASLLGIESLPLTSTSALNSGNTMPAMGDMGDMSDMPMSDPEVQAGIYQATALITSITATKVGLNHGDFINPTTKTVAMPAMTMNFPLANPAVAKGHKVGDSVRVSAREIDGGLVVEQLKSVTAPSKEMQP